MKRIRTVFLSMILVLFTVVYSVAVKIDGYDDGVEWQSFETDVEITGKQGNNVNYAAVKHKYIDEYEVYLFLYLSDNSSDVMDKAGFIVNLFDDLTVTVTDGGTQIKGNTSSYYVESEMAFIDENAASCEIIVGFKRGLPDNISGTVSFIDGQGMNSYFYPVSLNSDAELITQPYAAKPEKTTKPGTTEKKEATTKSKNTTTVKTSQKTTQAKKENKTVIYFYEKEIVVSQVEIIEPVQTVIVTQNIVPNETETVTQIRPSDLTTGFVMQRVVVAAGIILLIVGGAVAGMSIKKSKSADGSSDGNESDKE